VALAVPIDDEEAMRYRYTARANDPTATGHHDAED
jgi:hypothetical protein